MTDTAKNIASAAVTSWRTTVAGLMAAAAAIIPEVQAAIDHDPDTVADWNIVVAAVLVAFGLLAARDNMVRSEKAGAK